MSNRILAASMTAVLVIGAAACTKSEEPKPAAPAPAAEAPKAPEPAAEAGGNMKKHQGDKKPGEPKPKPDGEQT